MDILGQLRLCLDILLSAVLGFAIGFERKLRRKEAGIRTHTILCIGSCLMMVISMNAFPEGVADKARIAAQIVSGIGFLGAGMIVLKKHEVYGLTTAAGVWATAGIGMACGARLYLIAVLTTVVLVIIQYLLHLNIKALKHKRFFVLKIVFKQTDNENNVIKEIFNVTQFNHLLVKRTDDGIFYSASLNTAKEFSSSMLAQIITENPFIISLERCDDE